MAFELEVEVQRRAAPPPPPSVDKLAAGTLVNLASGAADAMLRKLDTPRLFSVSVGFDAAHEVVFDPPEPSFLSCFGDLWQQTAQVCSFVKPLQACDALAPYSLASSELPLHEALKRSRTFQRARGVRPATGAGKGAERR